MNVRDRVKELRRVKASELRPNPRNWRTHPTHQQDALKGILAEIGYADALLARETPDGLELVDGHLRAETTPDMEVPVLILDVDEDEAHKILLTLDPLAAMAGRDNDTLKELAESVDFESKAVLDMLERVVPPKIEEGLTDPDATPADAPTRCQEGDVWQLGAHRLMCGDSTNEEHVAALLDGTVPFIMVTDPPYGVDYDPSWRKEAAERGLIGFSPSAMGTVTHDERADWSEAYALFKGSVAYVWHASLLGGVVANGLVSSGFAPRSQIVWRKSSFAISRGHYHWQHECALYSAKGPSKWCGDRSQSTIWDIPHVKNETGHGTQKPIECMRRPIANHGGKDDHVYDPFVGSGTTIIAAQQLDRRCFAMEIDPKYCDIAIARWEEFTGEKAVKL